MKSKNGKNHTLVELCKDSYYKGLQKGMEKGHRNGIIEGIAFGSKNYSAVVVLILKDKLELSNEEVKRVTADINNYFDSIVNGYVSFEDVETSLKEDYDIDLNLLREDNDETRLYKMVMEK